LPADPALKVPTRSTVWTQKGDNALTPQTPVTLVWNNGAGLNFERIISIDKNYMFKIEQRVINQSAQEITLFPYASVTRHGIPKHATTVGYEGPFGFINDEAHKVNYKNLLKDQQTTMQATGGWIGFTEKYWLTALLPDQKKLQDFRFSAQKAEPENSSVFQVDVRGQALKIASGASASVTDHIFSGAKIVSLLNSYEQQLNVKHFDLAVDFGILYFLTRPMYFILNLFNGWFGNFGLAIIGLTLVVRAAVFPLANASYRSFAGMKKVAPKMTELRVRYGDDKQKLQQELIKLYETEKVNPMAGCFPLLLQIPIFFAVYKVISIAIEMRHAPFFGWIQDLSAIDPLTIFNGFGLLPFDVWSFLHIGPWSVAMLILMLIQKSMNPPPTDQIQKDIATFMPWVITFVMAKFPVGLVIYWTFSNLISVIQQYVIMRSMGVPVYLFAKDEALAYEASHTKKMEEAKLQAEKDREDKKKSIEDKKEKLKQELNQKDSSNPEEGEAEHLFSAPKEDDKK
jgi:YidC/Oxa1 family membrane protein insertase